MVRRRILAAAVCVASLAAACGPKKAVQVAPEPKDLIVLLPDPDDSSVGRASVSDQLGAVELAGALDATRVGARTAPTPVAPMEKAEVDGMFGDLLAGLPPAARHFTLYFEFGSDELTAESRALTTEILNLVRSRPNPDVIVVGHTDTSGSSRSNFELGLQRAAIVRNLLVAAGLDSTAIAVTSHGEGDLLIPTPDETQEGRNRRVEIDIQ